MQGQRLSIGSLIALLSLVGTARGVAAESDVRTLLAGVQKIPVLGAPGTIIPIAPQAFPLVVGESGAKQRSPVAVATRLGKGRIVAFGHGGYLGDKPSEDVLALLKNAIGWAAGTKKGRSGQVQVATYKLKDLAPVLNGRGIAATAVNGKDWRSALVRSSVFCCDTSFDNDPALAKAVEDFVRNGGGLITAGTGWGWAQLNPGKSLADDYLGNRVLIPAGLVVCNATVGAKSGKQFEVLESPPALNSAHEALVRLTATDKKSSPLSKEDRAQATHLLLLALRSLPADDRVLLPEVRQILGKVSAMPGPKTPIRETQSLERLAVVVADLDLVRQKPADVRPHPAAEAFPFSVPADAQRITAKRTIDTRIPNWHSMGLYAAPGELITVTVPEAAAMQRLAVRIGAHTDQLWDCKSWTRWPNIARRTVIETTQTRIANPFGGIVYLDVPDRCTLGEITVTVANAVPAPWYVLGKTSLSQWRDTIRKLPGPWAELQSPGVIVVVPSKSVRELDDPESVMKFWNRCVEAEDALAMWAPGDRKRPERFVADQQISVGYMHSGYPIMCGNDVYDYNLSVAKLTGTPEKPGGWGQWHELGHNHQSGDWTPSGCGEVTVNLFTMYVINQVYGVPLDGTRGEKFHREQRQADLRKYLASSRTPADWDPFEGLLMYYQLLDAFGWDTLKQVLAEYRSLRPGERPKSDVEKWDQWMTRYAKATGKNLGPFFVKWKLPVTPAALKSIEGLPPWMHADFRGL